MSKPKMKPYDDDLDYLEDECRFLRLRSARVELEREHREASFTIETGGDVRTSSVSLGHRIATLKQEEEETRALIESRRRATKGRLGIDQLAQEHALRDEERLLVIAVCIPALASNLAEEISGGAFGVFGASLTVEDLARMLAPATVREWAVALRLLAPEATLIQSGLLAVDHKPSDSPAYEWNGSRIYPSGRTLAAVLGQVETPIVTPGNGTEH